MVVVAIIRGGSLKDIDGSLSKVIVMISVVAPHPYPIGAIGTAFSRLRFADGVPETVRCV